MIPNQTDPRWRQLLTDRNKYEFSFLATSIMLSRVRTHVAFDASEENVNTRIEEVRAFFLKHGKNAERDLLQIFGVAA